MTKIKETQFGFKWGSADVKRYCSDEIKGWVVVGIETPKGSVQIYVTRTGKIRVSDKNGEWTKPKKECK